MLILFVHYCYSCTSYITDMRSITITMLMMCDMYLYIEILIFSFNIMIQYWLFGLSIHWNGLFSKHGFSNLPNFIPKSNYNKLVRITLIDFFYHFLINTTKQDVYLHFISISIIISNILILYHIVIFLAVIRNSCITHPHNI